MDRRNFLKYVGVGLAIPFVGKLIKGRDQLYHSLPYIPPEEIAGYISLIEDNNTVFSRMAFAKSAWRTWMEKDLRGEPINCAANVENIRFPVVGKNALITKVRLEAKDGFYNLEYPVIRETQVGPTDQVWFREGDLTCRIGNENPRFRT